MALEMHSNFTADLERVQSAVLDIMPASCAEEVREIVDPVADTAALSPHLSCIQCCITQPSADVLFTIQPYSSTLHGLFSFPPFLRNLTIVPPPPSLLPFITPYPLLSISPPSPALLPPLPPPPYPLSLDVSKHAPMLH
jgi:hypothetical protein